MSSIRLLSEVLDPVAIMSNDPLLSVSRYNGTGCFGIVRSSEASARATSNMSLNGINLPAIDKHTTRRDLYDLSKIGTGLLLASKARTIRPSWEDKSALLCTRFCEIRAIGLISNSVTHECMVTRMKIEKTQSTFSIKLELWFTVIWKIQNSGKCIS